jgi:hypothetical protein
LSISPPPRKHKPDKQPLNLSIFMSGNSLERDSSTAARMSSMIPPIPTPWNLLVVVQKTTHHSWNSWGRRNLSAVRFKWTFLSKLPRNSSP